MNMALKARARMSPPRLRDALDAKHHAALQILYRVLPKRCVNRLNEFAPNSKAFGNAMCAREAGQHIHNQSWLVADAGLRRRRSNFACHASSFLPQSRGQCRIQISDISGGAFTLNSEKIQDIQLLRTVAIGLVIAAHLSLLTPVAQTLRLTNPGWIGVELFFVISGYVVTLSLKRGGWEVVPFMVKRLFRLYPTLLLFVVLSIFANWLAICLAPDFASFLYTTWSDILGQSLSLLTWNHPSAAFGFSYQNGVLWSLSREFQFYALFAIGVALLKLVLPPTAKAFEQTALAVVLLLYLAGAFGRAAESFGASIPVGSWIAHGFFDFMLLGVIAALMPKEIATKIASAARPYALRLLIAPLAVLALIAHPHIPGLTSPLIPLALISSGLCFALLVIVAAETGLGSWVSPGLRHAGNIIGDRSYAIFVFHQQLMLVVWIVLYYINPFFVSGEWNWPFWQALVTLALLAPLTDFVHRKVERPMIAYGKRVARSMPVWRVNFVVPKQRSAGVFYWRR